MFIHCYRGRLRLITVLGVAALVGGCGGGSTPNQVTSTRATGRLTLSIVFPHAKSRQALPVCTQAVKVEVQEPTPSIDPGVPAGTELVQPIIVVPDANGAGTATANFDQIRVGQVHVVVTAYSDMAATNAVGTGMTGVSMMSGISNPDPVIVANGSTTAYVPITVAQGCPA